MEACSFYKLHDNLSAYFTHYDIFISTKNGISLTDLRSNLPDARLYWLILPENLFERTCIDHMYKNDKRMALGSSVVSGQYLM